MHDYEREKEKVKFIVQDTHQWHDLSFHRVIWQQLNGLISTVDLTAREILISSEQNCLIQWRWRGKNEKKNRERVASCRLLSLFVINLKLNETYELIREKTNILAAASLRTSRARCLGLSDDVINSVNWTRTNKQRERERRELSFDERTKTIERKESFLLQTLSRTLTRMDVHREEPWVKKDGSSQRMGTT